MSSKSSSVISNQLILKDILKDIILLKDDIKIIKEHLIQEAVVVETPVVPEKEKTPAGWFY
jgi:hypothetical protein